MKHKAGGEDTQNSGAQRWRVLILRLLFSGVRKVHSKVRSTPQGIESKSPPSSPSGDRLQNAVSKSPYTQLCSVKQRRLNKEPHRACVQKADFAHDGGGQRFGIRNSSTVAYFIDWIEAKSKMTHTKHCNERLFPKQNSTNKWSEGGSSTNSKLSHRKGVSTGSIKTL